MNGKQSRQLRWYAAELGLDYKQLKASYLRALRKNPHTLDKLTRIGKPNAAPQQDAG